MDSGTLAELIQYLREMLTELRDASGDDGALVPKVRKYIEDNYHKNISMESVARIFGVGYQKLSREFSKKTNESFKKYLIKVRMENAMDMILHTEYLLYEIAQMVGYANYENFSRMFYSYFKIWPKDIERH